MGVHPDIRHLLRLGHDELSLSARPRRTIGELLSGQEAFTLFRGPNVVPGSVRGYYIDFREKATQPDWPPSWYPWPGFHRFMGVSQWGLGCYERYLDGAGEEWLAAAVRAGDHLVERQEHEGPHAGAWLEPNDQRHTFHLRGPWASAMAQAQCASLLVRLYLERRDRRYADAATAGLGPMRLPSRAGGTRAELDGGAFPEEYPTEPPSFVLNGGIFGLWGYYDVWIGLDDEQAGEDFRLGLDTLIRHLDRWDCGFWSRYDLYPHRIRNVASGFYHALHIEQLRALMLLAPRPELARMLVRFERYARAPHHRLRAFLHKLAFRAVVPRTAAGPGATSDRT